MKIDTIEYIKEMNFDNMAKNDIQFCYDSIEDQYINYNKDSDKYETMD